MIIIQIGRHCAVLTEFDEHTNLERPAGGRNLPQSGWQEWPRCAPNKTSTAQPIRRILSGYRELSQPAPTELWTRSPCGLAETDLKVASRDANVSVTAERLQGERLS